MYKTLEDEKLLLEANLPHLRTLAEATKNSADKAAGDVFRHLGEVNAQLEVRAIIASLARDSPSHVSDRRRNATMITNYPNL
jgi:hypothetical protein